MKSILVVDDDPSCRASLDALFKKTYQTFLAESADQADKILGESQIDLMLLDIMMPRKNGIVYLRELMASHADLPVVMISAYSSPQYIHDSLKIGAVDYLTKPFDIAEVRHVVEQCLKGTHQPKTPEEISPSNPDLPPGDTPAPL